MQKSTFGFGKPTQEKSEREELGAIWEKTSRADRKFMNVRFKIDKQKLMDMINNSTEGDKVKLSFVAFPNDNHDGVDSRPNFRIYESKDRGTT